MKKKFVVNPIKFMLPKDDSEDRLLEFYKLSTRPEVFDPTEPLESASVVVLSTSLINALDISDKQRNILLSFRDIVISYVGRQITQHQQQNPSQDDNMNLEVSVSLNPSQEGVKPAQEEFPYSSDTFTLSSVSDKLEFLQETFSKTLDFNNSLFSFAIEEFSNSHLFENSIYSDVEVLIRPQKAVQTPQGGVPSSMLDTPITEVPVNVNYESASLLEQAQQSTSIKHALPSRRPKALVASPEQSSQLVSGLIKSTVQTLFQWCFYADILRDSPPLFLAPQALSLIFDKLDYIASFVSSPSMTIADLFPSCKSIHPLVVSLYAQALLLSFALEFIAYYHESGWVKYDSSKLMLHTQQVVHLVAKDFFNHSNSAPLRVPDLKRSQFTEMLSTINTIFDISFRVVGKKNHYNCFNISWFDSKNIMLLSEDEKIDSSLFKGLYSSSTIASVFSEYLNRIK